MFVRSSVSACVCHVVCSVQMACMRVTEHSIIIRSNRTERDLLCVCTVYEVNTYRAGTSQNECSITNAKCASIVCVCCKCEREREWHISEELYTLFISHK